MDKNAKHSDVLAAVRDLLDRAGLKPAEKLEHSGGIQIIISSDDAKL